MYLFEQQRTGMLRVMSSLLLKFSSVPVDIMATSNGQYWALKSAAQANNITISQQILDQSLFTTSQEAPLSIACSTDSGAYSEHSDRG